MSDITMHGACADCEQPVYGGEGVVVDPDGNVWHSDCRKVFRRKNATPVEGAVKRGPGRPRKEIAA